MFCMERFLIGSINYPMFGSKTKFFITEWKIEEGTLKHESKQETIFWLPVKFQFLFFVENQEEFLEL